MYIASNGIKTAVILNDSMAESPRDSNYQENLGTMVCWHLKYNLGDKHNFRNSLEFATDLALGSLSTENLIKAIVNGHFASFRAHEESDGSYSVTVDDGYGEYIAEWKISKDMEIIPGDEGFDVERDIYEVCFAEELACVCDRYGDVAILPVYLYDHSVQSVSTGSFVGRAHHAEWDSGQIGYIYMTKATAMENLALAADTIHIAMEGAFSKGIQVKAAGCTEFGDVMAANGYSPVKVEDIVNAEEHEYLASCAQSGVLYKKDHKLYRLNAREPDDSYQILAVATYNPDLKSLTDDTWRDRALEVLNAEVVDYDNYLRGEVYGYKLYEGFVEVDSCWGFNPGKNNICEVMEDELSGWFGSPMDFKYESGYDFDIDEYFEYNDFPALMANIQSEVEKSVHSVSSPWPYGVSCEDILQNKDEVLDEIVEALYEAHEEPTKENIHEVIVGVVGESREVKAKLTVADLDPDKDYTADEIMEILNKKPSLADAIAFAENEKNVNGRRNSSAPEKDSFDRDR